MVAFYAPGRKHPGQKYERLAKRGAGFADQRFKSGRFMHSQIGQNFTVNFNTGFTQPVDKLTIRQAMLTAGRIDTLNPQSAEIALAGATIAIRILPGLGNGLFGNTNGVFTTAVIAFRFR